MNGRKFSAVLCALFKIFLPLLIIEENRLNDDQQGIQEKNNFIGKRHDKKRSKPVNDCILQVKT